MVCLYAHVFIRCKLLSSDLGKDDLANVCEKYPVWLHAIGSQKTRRIYKLIMENIEIDHTSDRVFLHLYSC